MVTPESIKSKLQGLINKCADTTGVVDTNLTSAVNRVINGYGEGGGPDISKEATATADDIVAPKTAVVKGELITGNIPTALGGVSVYDVTPESGFGGMPYIRMSHTYEGKVLIDPQYGGQLQLYAHYESFGNAGPEDVVEGKTFTSAAGFKAVGTAKTYDEGKTDGYTEGKTDGREEGYAEGKTDGYAEGETAGIAAGKSEQRAEFWNKFQNYGNRRNYSYAFAFSAFEYIRPKFKVIPKEAAGSQYLFSNSLVKKVEKHYFDFSQLPLGSTNTKGIYMSFYQCQKLEEIEDVGLSPSHTYYGTFSGCLNLHTIAKITVSETTRFNGAFKDCNSLENLTIEGTIGQSGLILQWSTKLSKASIESIITHLSSTTSGLSVTLSKTSVDTAFETSEGAADGSTGEEWLALIAPKSNWTIQLL